MDAAGAAPSEPIVGRPDAAALGCDGGVALPRSTEPGFSGAVTCAPCSARPPGLMPYFRRVVSDNFAFCVNSAQVLHEGALRLAASNKSGSWGGQTPCL